MLIILEDNTKVKVFVLKNEHVLMTPKSSTATAAFVQNSGFRVTLAVLHTKGTKATVETCHVFMFPPCAERCNANTYGSLTG